MAPTLDSREVLKRNKTSVSFNEVAVYFSEEEWRNLEPLQKKLYNNVMREIHKTVISLGHTIAHPDVLCRIQKDPNPYIHSQDEDRKATCFPATSSSVLSPDVLFRIKHDEDSNSNNEESPVNNCASKFSRDIGDEPNFASVKNEELYHTDADEIPANFEYPIKIPSGPESEDDMFKINRKDFVCGEGNSRSREVSQLVFNPKLSLWIKQVDGPSQCEDKKESENPSHESNGLKKTDDHSVVESVQKVASEHFSNKENTNEKRPTQHKGISGNKSEQPTKGEESLLSIVLKRANAGSLYMPSYKYLNDFKSSEYSKGIPRIVGKETFYDSKKSFHIPNSNEMLSSIKVKSVPHQQNLHEMDKPYRCNVCEKNFKTVGILNVHMRTHSGIRPYQCNECGKSFRDNWNLKVHQKIHTGETPYKCSICDKGFIQYATYMKHQRIHTGEKPYACCYCDKSFTNSSNLVRHHRTHTGEKPYICMECGKSFSYNTSLIQHKILHRFDTVENVSKDSEKK